MAGARNYKIAVIPGDGIGHEVVPEGIRVVEAAGKRFDFSLEWRHFDWSCDTYRKTGRMMPEDGLDQLRGNGSFKPEMGVPHRMAGLIRQQVTGREWLMTLDNFAPASIEFVRSHNRISHLDVEDLSLDDVFKDVVRGQLEAV